MKKKVDVEDLKKDSLKQSIFEGSAHSVMMGAGHSFIVPYALALNSGNLLIGFLNSFMGIIGPLAQLKSPKLMEIYSRKKIILWSIMLQSLMWIPVILLIWMFYRGILMNYLPILLIIFYSLLIAIGAVAGPPWFSLMGDLVPEKSRGRYFAKRNRIIGFVTLASMLIAGFVLDFFKTKGIVLIGFLILFTIAGFARFFSFFLFKKHYDPGIKLKRGYYFSFFDFLKHARNNNFGKFAIFTSLIFLAVSVSSPFFAVYMLDELKLSYVWFIAITLAPGILSLIVLPFWGRVADKYGNRLVIFISALAVPFFPFLWLVSTSKIYLLIVPSIFAGIFWGAFNFASSNFIYDSVNSEHRALCSAYYNLLAGAGIFLGSILGGLITRFISIELINGFFNLEIPNIFLFVFLVSGILRGLVVIGFLRGIKEVRKTKISHGLVRELNYLHTVEHGINKFSSDMHHYSRIPRVNSSQLDITKIFK
ncbi:MAG: MFS transporter [Nanoarchaeota archaeon]|nr:MFS transporter [Nanoarchaeota archaeon]